MQIEIEPYENGYRLVCVHPIMGRTPAGWRLMRLGAPNIKFNYEYQAEAFKAATKLQEHIAEFEQSKEKRRTEKSRISD